MSIIHRPKRVSRILLFLLIPIALTITLIVLAAPGDLDTTFGTGGIVTTPLGGVGYNPIVIQPDGKLVVVGSSGVQPALDVAVVRYNTDGSLDTSFDSDGSVVTDLGGNDVGSAVALQSDGKIVVAGESNSQGNYDFYVVRYNTDGSLDTSFDTDGMVFTAIGSLHDRAYAVAVQADGKIVVGGYGRVANNDFVVVRYCTDGSLDNGTNCGATGFGTGGIVTTSIGGAQDQIYSIVIQADGKILAGGYSNNTAGPNYAFTVARYNTDGTLDTSFDTDGIAQTIFSTGLDLLYGLAIQPDGKIVGAGFDSAKDIALVRYNTDGSLDTSFDSDGTVTTTLSDNDEAYGVTLQSDGKIIVVGRTHITLGDFDYFVTRYNADGSLDTTFSSDGIVVENVGADNNSARGAIVQADGKIVVAGSAGGFTLIRYEGDNTPPVAADDAGANFTTDEDTAFTTGNVLDNDMDDGILSVLSFDDTGLLGTLISNGDGTFEYDPNGMFESLLTGQQAQDIFTYVVSDGALTDTATVTITINGLTDSFATFLPFVANNVTYAPDLVVADMAVTANSVQVVVMNQGLTAVTDDFWVDVYINPNTAPTGVNQTWETQGGEGVVWGVTNVTLQPGESLILDLNSAAYAPSLSNFSGTIATGSAVYAQVDSANVNTTYGNVLETHEILGEPYNNIMMVTAPTPVNPARLTDQKAAAQPDFANLPTR